VIRRFALVKLYDAHNHLHDKWLVPHHREVFATYATLGVARAVVNGTCEADWAHVAALASAHSFVLPAFGLHPWNVGNRSPDWLATLHTRLDATPTASVGEIGLDGWMLNRARPDDPRLVGRRRAPLAEQIQVFTAQLALAAERSRAASIHCLDAFGALLDVLRAAQLPARGFLLHAYGGPAAMIEAFTALGAYFSFNSAFLDARYLARQSAFRLVPADRLLVETDAPAMPPPLPWRTHRLPPTADGFTVNHPGNLECTYRGLAALRGISSPDLSAQVEVNFHRLFRT
jgi:TatD DNase family protein